jgi:Carboxypeptidase regulatory-like domain
MTAAAAVCWTVLALASPQSQPMTARQPPPATGLIVGRVVDGGTGRPVAGAIVTVGGAPGQPRAMTNANGQFVFRKLARGPYLLSANRAGYVTGTFGSRRPGGMSLPLQLTEGERVSDVVIPIWKHATISGRVTDEAGEPLIGVQVRAFQRRVVGGRRRMAQGPMATTDDRGIYRMTALSPGEYLVAFVWKESAVPIAVAELMRTPTSNDPKVQEIIRERLNMGTGFSSVGSSVQVGGLVRDLQSGAPVPPSSGDDSSVFIYPTQFYPGVSSAARAATITLASGQEREAVDFTLAPVKTAKVSGTLIGPEGPVPNTALRLISATDEALTDLETSITMTGAGGDFTLLGVPPGQYTLKALRVPRPPVPTTPAATSMTQIQMGSGTIMTSLGGAPSGPASPPPIPDDPTMFADTPVSVGNRDVSDIVVMVQRGARVTGRFEFDGTRERPNATGLMRIPVIVERTDAGNAANPGDRIPAGRADETGAFKTYGVAAGKYLIRIGGAPSGWTLRSVMADGRDVSEVPLDLRTTDVANVVVTFTDRPTKLTGVARTSAGNGDPDAGVIVFPADSTGWSDYGLNPRRVRSTHAGRDGSYVFTGLPPGDYYVAAIHEDTTPEWLDPRVLEDLARGASQVRLAEGDTRTQDLKTVKGGSQ